MAHLKEGDKAPVFTGNDQNGKSISLSDYSGKAVVLYFYPKDDTPGCTKEACMLRDAWRDFTDANALVFGVSKDTIKSHGKFAQKYSLPFPLLADEDTAIADDLGEALSERGGVEGTSGREAVAEVEDRWELGRPPHRRILPHRLRIGFLGARIPDLQYHDS